MCRSHADAAYVRSDQSCVVLLCLNILRTTRKVPAKESQTGVCLLHSHIHVCLREGSHSLDYFAVNRIPEN